MPETLSIATIYRDSSRTWLAHFLRLTVLAAVLEAPIVVAELTLHVAGVWEINTEESLTFNAAALIVATYASLSHHFLSGLLEKLVGAERHGHEPSTIGEILRDLPWARLLVADLLLAFMTVVGLLLLIVPGILIATWLTPWLVLINLERQPLRASALRSYQLVKGHFWKVLFVWFIALAVVEVASELAGALAHLFSHAEPVDVLAHAVPATLLMPIAALPIVMLTFELVAMDAHERAHAAAEAFAADATPDQAETEPAD